MLNRGWLKWVAVGIVALWLLLGAPSLGEGAERVRGSGDFTGAPALGSGTYSDSIRLREELFYAVELAEGQSLRVAVRLLGRRGGPQDPTVAAQLRVYDPLRDLTGGTDLVNFSGTSTSKLALTGEEVSPQSTSFESAGTYYFSVRLFELVGDERESPLKGLEFQTRLDVTVAGVALEPSPTASGSPSAEPTVAETDVAGPTPPSEEPPYIRVFLLTFLVGVVVGFGVVLIRGLARRAPRARPRAPS